MRKIIIQEFITLDGVMQAPGGPEEDPSEDFKYGGWTAPYYEKADKEADALMQRWMKSADLLLGRKTYDIFAAYWPEHGDLWPGVNEVTKYVASRSTDTGEADWNNSVFLKDVDEIKKLKEGEGGDIQVIGSGNLCQTLFQYDLVDEMRLMTFPITLGAGKKLFAEGTIPAAFTVTESLVASNGVIFACYKRAGEVRTGTVG
ncbi:MAG TPA: dihydrofolate reductase family protein [Dongiaceae bacterium]|nr:dihydrofolate reductase family protein [Dongiaceae bacterium]